MGYTSKVICGVKTGTLSKEFEKLLKKNRFLPSNSEDWGNKRVREVDDFTTYEFDYIKWYHEDDLGCKEIMDWLETQEDECKREEDIGDGETIPMYEDINVFCIAMGEDGKLHSEVGDWYEYVDTSMDIELQK